MVVPQTSLVGEAETDDNAPSSSSSSSSFESEPSAAVGRRWAALRLLLSLAMRESSGAIFTRWARDRLASTNDEGFAEDPPTAPLTAEGGSDAASAPALLVIDR